MRNHNESVSFHDAITDSQCVEDVSMKLDGHTFATHHTSVLWSMDGPSRGLQVTKRDLPLS